MLQACIDSVWVVEASGGPDVQVATHSTILLVDMLNLHTSAALNKCLSTMLRDAGILKLGCRLSDDINQLHRSYPDMEAFQSAEALLDLTPAWTLYMQEHNDQVSTWDLVQGPALRLGKCVTFVRQHVSA